MGRFSLDVGGLNPPPDPGPLGRGLDRIGSTMDNIIERRRRQQEAEAQRQLQLDIQKQQDARLREQHAATIAQQKAEAEQRADLERQKQLQAKRAAGAQALTKDVMPALREGRGDEAAAIGALHGINIEREALPEVGPAPAAAPPPRRFFADPMDAAMNRPRPQMRASGPQDIAQAEQGADAMLAQQPGYQRQQESEQLRIGAGNFDRQQAYEDEVAAHQRATQERVQAEKRGPRYKIGIDGGPVLSYDGNELRNAQAQKADRASQAFGQTSTADIERKADASMNAALREGTVKPEAAAAYRQSIIEAEKNRIAGMDRARVAGSRAGQITPAKRVDDERALATGAHTLLGQELTREDYKAQLTAARDGRMMLDLLSSDNAAGHKRALGLWAKQAAGPGAVTDSERDEFVNNVGGQDERLKKIALKFLSDGEAPEGQLQIFRDALTNVLQKRVETELGAVRESVRDAFASHPNPEFRGYSDWAAERVARTALGPSKINAAAVGQPDTERKKQEMREFLKQNPALLKTLRGAK